MRALQEIAEAEEVLRLQPGPGILCNGAALQVASFRTLAGYGLVNVIDGCIVITEAGREFLSRRG
ncbi:MAG: hypothetical protein JO111_06115 [Caulobacteraceae bacterium]|nr:hypothetical protein [Caulobacteraceae bacterium]